ncbi:glycosyltransferase family 2 protein [Maridesulfovibrio sp. FT414]|uniref:glycosyltransferase family 2 protein n=1 Tax=Maridesulfovibrio sp. FT414 TaxID=2979469 RepID=UPI003D800822
MTSPSTHNNAQETQLMAITGLVLTYNGERLLDEALQSLSFCSEILLVDSGSTDGTLDIAKKHNARVVFNAWKGAIEQHKFAQTQISTEWVVTIDQDEMISPALRESIMNKLANPDENLDGYYCPRRSWYLDRFIMHSGWYPDRLYRVFRHGRITIGGVRPHEELRPIGKAGELSGDIIHYPYENFFQHMGKINEYTQDAAEDLYSRGKRGSLGSAIGHGIGKFFKQYILKAGFLDGRAGFIVAVHGFFYTFQKYIRLVELEMKDRK